MHRIRPYLSLILVICVVLVLVFLGMATLMGGKVSTVFSSINSGLDGGSGVYSPAASRPYPAPAVAGEVALEQSNGQTAASDSLADQPQVQRLVVRTADLSIEAENVRDAEAAVQAAAAQFGGYVVKVETSGAEQHLTSRIIFRVPATRFDEALSGVQGLAKKVLARTVSGDDVTEEFVDLTARLTNLEVTRDRLQAFLDKAITVEDALKVNQSLSDIQGQIEQLKGRKQYLQQSVALSTISVYLTPVPVTPIVAEDSWKPVQVARGALRGLIGFGQILANVAIVALVWSPVWLLLLLGLWVWRRLRRRTPSGPAAPEAA
jgi:uncharacterized protein DUF4349